MPTYSYRCTACGNAFDIAQAFTDDTLTVCPKCGGRLRKLYSAVGVAFNGSGFYRTDSRAPAGKASGGAEAGAGGGKDSGASASSSGGDGVSSSSSGGTASSASPQ